jgi:NAD(P)H-hydrate epimerase
MNAMHILSAAEMQACDRATTEQFLIPSIDLMRNAGAAVAGFVREQFPETRRVTVLCGTGNNGGDGMMAARLLSEAGLDVITLLLGEPEQLKGDAAIAWSELNHPRHGEVRVVAHAFDPAEHDDAFRTDLIVDALFGTGFRPPLPRLALAAHEWMWQSPIPVLAPVLAIDLPSGWLADGTSATPSNTVFDADAVITFTAPKPAHVFGKLTRRWNQPVVVASIGSPEGIIRSELNLDWAGSSLEFVQRPRRFTANKGDFGHVLVVGGAFGSAGGKAGAPAMTALAALRAGAGLVTAAVPAPALPVVASFAPELMTWPLVATAQGRIAAENLEPDRLDALTEGKTVLAIGPGLGQDPETAKFVTGLLAATTIPAVIDADALNIFAQNLELLDQVGKGRTMVLTPHPGELARLYGCTVADVQEDRLAAARNLVISTGATVVLKGARTIIAHPDFHEAVNTSGNPGMAKGGSGDVLAGLIAGLLAQHPNNPVQAVEAAVYLHGLAADLAVCEGDQHTLLATDLLAYLPQAFQSRAHRFEVGGKSGYVWLQGACSSRAARAKSDARKNVSEEVQQ